MSSQLRTQFASRIDYRDKKTDDDDERRRQA